GAPCPARPANGTPSRSGARRGDASAHLRDGSFTLGHLALHHGLSTIPARAARFVDKFAGRATGFVDKSVDHSKGQRLWLSRSEEPEAPPVLRSHQRVVDALGSSGRFCAPPRFL